MSESIVVVFQIAVPVFLILLALTVGKAIEKAHFRSIRRREQELSHLLVTNTKRVPEGLRAIRTKLCVGSVVVAPDYFKSLGAYMKALVGGRLRTLETLLERARREAILRMVEEANRIGSKMVLNVRLETNAIKRSSKGGKETGVEVLAYGTAIITDKLQ